MPSSLLSFVGCIGADPDCLTLIREAAQRLDPHVHVQTFASLEQANTNGRSPGGELLALCAPSAAEVTKARNITDDNALPRWAVVVLGGIQTASAAASQSSADSAPPASSDGSAAAARPIEIDVPVITRDECTPAVLAQAFRGALTELRLRRENVRLRGDLGTFGSRIAHDLRTPLGGVLTTAEMLQEILSESDPASAALMHPILESTDGLAKLIERMSFFAKAIASREPRQPLSMGTPFWNAFQQLEGRLLNAGASLAQPRDWPTVEGHPAWLQIVWRNLLANAVQHNGAGLRIEAGWDRTDEGFRFWLHDSGEVPADRRGQLFRPFHRLNEPGAPRGLGLAVVQRLVELDGGSCGFEAPAAGGSTFFFTLPAVPQPAAAGTPVTSPG